jgi:hypothetical protein
MVVDSCMLLIRAEPTVAFRSNNNVPYFRWRYSGCKLVKKIGHAVSFRIGPFGISLFTGLIRRAKVVLTGGMKSDTVSNSFRENSIWLQPE